MLVIGAILPNGLLWYGAQWASSQGICTGNLGHATTKQVPDSKVHGANMEPIWGRQDPGGPMLAPWTLLSGVPVYVDDRYKQASNRRWKVSNEKYCCLFIYFYVQRMDNIILWVFMYFFMQIDFGG